MKLRVAMKIAKGFIVGPGRKWKRQTVRLAVQTLKSRGPIPPEVEVLAGYYVNQCIFI